MAIYDIFEHVEKCTEQNHCHLSPTLLNGRHSHTTLSDEPDQETHNKHRFFSSIAARLFFFMLLIADLAWGVYCTALFSLLLVLNLITGFRLKILRRFYVRRYLNLKRAFICGISLVVALFSPALGTMFACTYFLMYDKKGVEEVVPSVLQDQFREFFT